MNKNIYILLVSICLVFAVNQNDQKAEQNSTNCTNCYEPIADSGKSQTYFKGGTVTLDGTASYDLEGADLTYLWTPPEGILLDNNTSSMPQFTAPDVSEDTDYVIELIVNDGEYNSDPDYVTISVVVINTAPVIESIDELTVNKNTTFTIDASTSYDATLTGTLNFQFTAPGFAASDLDSSIVQFIAPAVSTDTDFTILLDVSDGVDVESKNIQILVLANIKPYAIPGEDIQVAAGVEFTLDGSSSYDPDNTGELSYLWSWDDDVCEFEIVEGEGGIDKSTITLQAPLISNVDCEVSLTVNDTVEDSEESHGTGLFISEYIESGSDGISCSQDKLIEIYNPTAEAIDLTDFFCTSTLPFQT